MIPVDKNKLVEVTLADGITRHLRYSLGARKRICEKFGAEPAKLLAVPVEDLVPTILMEGLVEREGITIERLMEDGPEGPALVNSQMTDEVVLQFIDAFFVPRVAQNLRRVIEAVQGNGERALALLETKAQSPAPGATPTVQ